MSMNADRTQQMETSQEDMRDIGFAVVSVELLIREPSWTTGVFAPDDYRLLTVTEGKGTFVADGEEGHLSAGKAVLLAPGTIARLSAGRSAEAGRHLRYYQLDFRLLAANGTGRNPVFPSASLHGVQPEFLHGLAELHRLKDERGLEAALERQIWLYRLLLDIAGDDRNRSSRTSARDLVEETIGYIRRHFDAELTVEELAARAKLGRWQYSKLFKEMTGCSPTEYIGNVRIEHAKRLLLLPGGRQEEIALSTGFRDESYFNRRFRKLVGMTPRQYGLATRSTARIVALYMEDYLVALGIRPVLRPQPEEFEPYRDYLGLQDVPGYCYSHSVRALAEAEPDLLLLSYYHDPDSREKYAKVAPTYDFRWNWAEMDWKSEFRELARFMGKTAEAEAAIAVYEAKAVAARDAIVQAAGRPTVTFLRIGGERLMVYGDDSGGGYIGPIVYGDLALVPPDFVREVTWGRRDPFMISFEQIALISADWVFVIAPQNDATAATRERLNRHPDWQAMPAYRNGRIVDVKPTKWLNNGIISNAAKIDVIVEALTGTHMAPLCLPSPE